MLQIKEWPQDMLKNNDGVQKLVERESVMCCLNDDEPHNFGRYLAEPKEPYLLSIGSFGHVDEQDQAFAPGTKIPVHVLFFNDLLEAYEIMKVYWKEN